MGFDFGRRALWYRSLDLELRAKTRFFGAAALTNRVLARLYENRLNTALPLSGRLLMRLGTELERFNTDLAASVRGSEQRGRTLDRRLVCAEQRVAQIHWLAERRNRDRPLVERELNGFLNQSHVSCLLARLWKDSHEYCTVLASLRARMGSPLDFAVESHRVDIGCALIEHLNRNHEPLGCDDP